MPLLRNKYIWLPFYIFIASFLLLNFQRKGLVALVALVLAVAVADNISSQLIKKSVQRLRPCKVLEPQKDMYLRVPCGSGYSFPSSHATNHFTVATYLVLLLGRLFKWIKLPFITGYDHCFCAGLCWGALPTRCYWGRCWASW